MGPGGDHADQEQDEDDEQDGSQCHGVSRSVMSGSGRALRGRSLQQKVSRSGGWVVCTMPHTQRGAFGGRVPASRLRRPRRESGGRRCARPDPGCGRRPRSRSRLVHRTLWFRPLAARSSASRVAPGAPVTATPGPAGGRSWANGSGRACRTETLSPVAGSRARNGTLRGLCAPADRLPSRPCPH